MLPIYMNIAGYLIVIIMTSAKMMHKTYQFFHKTSKHKVCHNGATHSITFSLFCRPTTTENVVLVTLTRKYMQ